MSNFPVIPSEAPAGADPRVEEALTAASFFTALGLTEVTAENGNYYSRNPDTGVTVVAAPGLIVRERQAVVETVMARPGSSLDELIRATAGFTQKQRAAFVGRRQPTVARRLAK